MNRRRGIARLVEVILASVLLTASLSISYYYLIPANPNVQRGTENLDKFGFDLLSTLSSQGGFDDAILNSTGVALPNWQQNLNVVLGTLMPVGIDFNLTVYEAVRTSGGVSGPNLVGLSLLNTQGITNAQASSFANAGQVTQITLMYTTSSFYTLVFFLQLAEATNM